MGDVFYLGSAIPAIKFELPTPTNDTQTGEVVHVDFGRSGSNPPESSVFNNLRTLLKTYSIDFGRSDIRKDFEIVTHLVQGMMDRSVGGTKLSSSACLMLDALRLTMGYEEEPDQDDTNKLFGDLLDQIDRNGKDSQG